ncbi:MAG: hypothetical protein B7C24_03275 [Bacteroidetes bacterium 4572_77]|nr:MAG: hypothetical protein B7C24_03275 [Bacteroidetes bacterium 4572_77]
MIFRRIATMATLWALLLAYNSFAQTIPLKPLIQVFTSSTCGACNYGNEVLDSVLNNNQGNYSLIKYQVSWPAPGDPYSTSEAALRVDYYGVSAVPMMFIDTVEMIPWNLNQEVFDSFLANTTGMGIQINSAEINDENILSLSFDLHAEIAYDAGLKLHAAVVEKTTLENVGNNGETEFHYVMLKMLPNVQGFLLDSFDAGDTKNFEWSGIDMNDSFMEQANDLALIIFVQDDNNHQIIQSEMQNITPDFLTYSATLLISDCSGEAIMGAEVNIQGVGNGVSDENGELIFDNIAADDYYCTIEKDSMEAVFTSLSIINQDIEEEILMEASSLLFFEDFASGIPDDWLIYKLSPNDFVYEISGKVVLFRQSLENLPLMLVSPSINVDEAEIISFDLGEQDASSNPICSFGYLVDSADPESFVELSSYEVTNYMKTHEKNISYLSGDIHFAWRHQGGDAFPSYFRLDNISLKESTQIPAPVNLSLENLDNSYVDLIWENYNVCNKNVVTYHVYRKENDGDFDRITSIFENAFTDGPLNGNYYEYYVSVEVDGVESEPSNVVSVMITSIEEKNIPRFTVYPNPAKDNLYIEANNKILQFSVYNKIGQLLLQEEKNSKHFSQNIAAWKQGVYYLRFQTDNSIHSQCVIKE